MNLKLSVKHIVAIVLVVLSVILLFWPSVVGLSAYGMGQMQSVSGVRSEMTENMDLFFKSAEIGGFRMTLLGILAIVINICFFGMIAAAVLAIVMIILNKSNFATIIMIILAILAVVVSVVYALIAKELSGLGDACKIVPGVSMFLLPIFTIAACIFAKKEA